MTSIRRRLLANAGANIFGRVLTVVAQIVSGPLLLHQWGAGLYGEWILLSAIPSYFAISDIGFGNVAGNEMTMLVAAGKTEEALDVFQPVSLFITSVSLAMCCLLALGIWFLPVGRWLQIHALSIHDVRFILLLLGVSALLTLQEGLFQGAFRCVGKYAVGITAKSVVMVGKFKEMSGRAVTTAFVAGAVFSTALFVYSADQLAAETPAPSDGVAQTAPDTGRPSPVCEPSKLDSPYIPVDSWIYPAIMRLYGLGFVDTVYLGMRPWTRATVEHMLEEASAHIEDAQDYPNSTLDEAQQIYEAVNHDLYPDIEGPCGKYKGLVRLESTYTISPIISGTPLHDSFHLGQTIIDNYGRPYENGFNNYTGGSGYAAAGRFLIYVRGELQHAPSASGYSPALAQTLSKIDLTIDPARNQFTYFPQSTIPLGPESSITRGRFLEAYVSSHIFNHEIALGKQDYWLGPGLGGGFAYSNNAEGFYSLSIDRTDPLHIPWLSYITGPFRYEFAVGGLRGHTYIPNPKYPGPGQPNVINPGDPWMHFEKISFKPTENLEFGFERSAIWGGHGHGPITVHTFLKSFFSLASPPPSEKLGRDDPGARFASFDFSWRLPFVRHWLTLYSDSEVHDDVSPIDAPRRAGWRSGLYLSHMPGVPKLDLRAEATYTDPPVSTSQLGRFMYWESIQRQGYTNNGQIMGDWIGREGKGGQAWVTWHLSGNEWLQASVRNQKVAKDFIPGSSSQMDPATGRLIEGGTTLNDIGFQAVKRIGRDLEINGSFVLEHWKAPIYLAGQQTVTATTISLTWYPDRKVAF